LSQTARGVDNSQTSEIAELLFGKFGANNRSKCKILKFALSELTSPRRDWLQDGLLVNCPVSTFYNLRGELVKMWLLQCCDGNRTGTGNRGFSSELRRTETEVCVQSQWVGSGEETEGAFKVFRVG